jgi:PIN domain-containing protein
MIKVVVDTNSLGAGKARPLQSNQMKRLLTLTREGTLKLVVAEVVIREAATKWAERVVSEAGTYVKARRTLVDAGLLQDEKNLLPQKGSLRSAEEERIRQALVEVGGEIAPLPSAPHADVVARALDRLQPFDSKGRNGYRDVILWETVLEMGGEGDPVIFVSNDQKAFFEDGDQSKGLAIALTDEVRIHFGEKDGVQLYSELEPAVDAALKLSASEQQEQIRIRAAENQAAGEELNERLANATFRQRLDEGVEAALIQFDLGQDLRDFGIPDSDVAGAFVEAVEGIERHRFASVYQLPDGNVLADLIVDITLVADLTVHPADALLLDEQPQVSITDIGWGGSVAEGQAELAARITLECEIDTEDDGLAAPPEVSEVVPMTPKEFLAAAKE